MADILKVSVYTRLYKCKTSCLQPSELSAVFFNFCEYLSTDSARLLLQADQNKAYRVFSSKGILGVKAV